MAESTITQSQIDLATPELDLIDVETGSTIPASRTGTAETLSADDITTLRRENEELRKERDRQRAGNSGAQAEARRLTERLAAVEGFLQGRSQPSSTQQSTSDPDDLSEDELDQALTKWLNNDKSGLTTLKQKLRPSARASQVTEADIDRLVVAKLSDIGNKANLQSVVTQRHPEFADPKGSLATQVWDAYDNYKSDPHNALLYPEDPKTSVPMYGPDGSVKMVDARLVDRMCLDFKSQSNFQAGRDQEARDSSYGTVQSSSTSNGRTRRTVDASELFSASEVRTWSDPKVLKGWPELKAAFESGGVKGLTKFVYDGLPPEDKARRLASYRARGGR